MDFKNRLKEKREENFLTQKELADLVGLTQNAISGLELGRIKGTTRIVQIAKALNTSPNYLLYGNQRKELLADSESPTNETYTSYNRTIPILPQTAIMRWIESGELPDNYRSINMTDLPVAELSNSSIYCIDITDDSFVDNVFKIKLPNKTLLAIVNPDSPLNTHDIIIANDGTKTKIRQYIKDGEDFYVRSFDYMSELVPVRDVNILGVLVGYLYRDNSLLSN